MCLVYEVHRKNKNTMRDIKDSLCVQTDFFHLRLIDIKSHTYFS